MLIARIALSAEAASLDLAMPCGITRFQDGLLNQPDRFLDGLLQPKMMEEPCCYSCAKPCYGCSPGAMLMENHREGWQSMFKPTTSGVKRNYLIYAEGFYERRACSTRYDPEFHLSNMPQVRAYLVDEMGRTRAFFDGGRDRI